MKYIHLKTGNIYEVLSKDIINTTNKDDGMIMVLYEGITRNGKGNKKFVRELNEFLEKFKPFEK